MLGVRMNRVKYFEKEISYIRDESKKRDIGILIDLLPDYFFSIPMSNDDSDCPKYGLTKNGLVKYTKVAGATGFQVRYKIKGKWKVKTFKAKKKTKKYSIVLKDNKKKALKKLLIMRRFDYE